MATLSPDQRELIAKLHQYDVVKRVEYDFYEIRVWFSDGYKERWALRPRRRNTVGRIYIPKTNLLIRPIPTLYEYETKLFDDARNAMVRQLFAVQCDDIAKSGFGDIRIKIHQLIASLLNEGWVNPRYPPEALALDYYNLKNRPWENYASSVNYVNLHAYKNPPGYLTATHFAKDLGSVTTGARISLRDAWKHKQWLKRAIEGNLRLGRDVTRTSLIRALTTFITWRERFCGFRFLSPLFYHAIIKNILKLNNPVILDAKPLMGTVLMATALSKGTYITADDPTIDVTAMGKHFGIDTIVDDGETTADVVFTGMNNYTPDEARELIARYKHRCDMLIIPMNPWYAEELKVTHPPKRTIRAKLGIHQIRFLDSLFIY